MTKHSPEVSQNHSSCCHWQGCDHQGVFPAPQAPDRLQEKYYFCLEHIRQYNANWDYFASSSTEEIEKFQKEALSGHRPIQSNDNFTYRRWLEEHLTSDAHREEDRFARLTRAEKNAFHLLGLHSVVEWKEIRKRYKALAKKHHPDINKEHNEEMLKAINQAYALLKQKYGV